ncbi:hypothetical protein [Streptomyces neyagawaensis]|uniref:hypothetical protein n=1 Tax=Streptomyces neyagawaensis TaxID=42238 RepID=UPI0006E28A9E
MDLLKTGQPAEIHAELGQRRFSARLVSVADTPGSPRRDTEDGEEDTGDERTADGSGCLVVLRPDKPIGAELSGQDVRVTIRAAPTKGRELVVPITAVTAGRWVPSVAWSDQHRRARGGGGRGGPGVVPCGPPAGGDDGPLIGLATGGAAGLYPAWRAARVEPVEALRR